MPHFSVKFKLQHFIIERIWAEQRSISFCNTLAYWLMTILMRAYTPDHELGEQVVPESHLHVTVHLHLFIYGGSRCITLKGLLVATTYSVGKR